MNKRTFLQRLASTIAALALAPALCRGIGRLETYQEPEWEIEWTEVKLKFTYASRPVYPERGYEVLLCTVDRIP